MDISHFCSHARIVPSVAPRPPHSPVQPMQERILLQSEVPVGALEGGAQGEMGCPAEPRKHLAMDAGRLERPLIRGSVPPVNLLVDPFVGQL